MDRTGWGEEHKRRDFIAQRVRRIPPFPIDVGAVSRHRKGIVRKELFQIKLWHLVIKFYWMRGE